MRQFSMTTWLDGSDRRAGHGQTVDQWIRDKSEVITLAAWLRDGGSENEFLARHLPAINRYSNTELGADDVIVRGSMLCNSRRDYYYSRFTPSALNEIAELAPGAPKMRMHDYRTGSPEARTFDARVVQVEQDGVAERDSLWVQTLFYMLNDDAGKALARRIDAGIDKEVSIGWRCVGADCSECDEPIWSCRHIPGDIYERGIAEFQFSGITSMLEDSFVFRGGQKDTTTFVPEGAAPEPVGTASAERFMNATAVASAVNRFMSAMSGDMSWDRIASVKREFLIEIDRMPRGIRLAAEQYRRAIGIGTMCAEPGDRRNTQSLRLARSSFKSSAAARRWARDHDFRADRMTTTSSSFLFEQQREDLFEADAFRMRNVDEGVKARVGTFKPKENESERSRADDGWKSRSVDHWLAGATT